MYSSNCTRFFLAFTLSPTFLILFTFSSPQTFYLDITIPFSFFLPLFCFFLSLPSYYKFVTLFHSLHSFLSQKGSLSLSLSQNVLVDFYFLLHLRFRLRNFSVFKNSNLGWYDLVLYFKLLSLLFCYLIVKFYPITL